MHSSPPFPSSHCICLCFPRLSLIMDNFSLNTYYDGDEVHSYVFVILGASGDLARKKIYPTLWWLYRDRLLPEKTYFLGYARSDLSVEVIREKSAPYMIVNEEKLEEMQLFEQFWKTNTYIRGSYTESKDFEALDKAIVENCGHFVNRIFYLALPPFTYMSSSSQLAKSCMSKR